eukprot:GHVH01003835.1.p1 GENE.GHVH01003835.1~~GHVH01003835.1.p1  ORF type:complete len:229 (+),score=36.48 GHVH01003835.1:610-1296(+)
MECPEIDYVERVVEVSEPHIVERVVSKPVIKEVERIIEVPTLKCRERIENYTVYEEKVIEHIKEVPYVVEDVIEQEVEVVKSVVVEVPEEEIVDVYEFEDLDLNFPVPIKQEINIMMKMPKLIPKYRSNLNLFYYPRFIEVPVASELLDQDTIEKCEAILTKIDAINTYGTEQYLQNSSIPRVFSTESGTNEYRTSGCSLHSMKPCEEMLRTSSCSERLSSEEDIGLK